MIKRANELSMVEKCVRNGPGVFQVTALASQEELRSMAKELSMSVLKPGCGSGYHTHDANCEIYYILKGELEYNDNGTMTTVRAGDVTVTKDGQGHCIVNQTDEPAALISLII